jgi:hypothetical protein
MQMKRSWVGVLGAVAAFGLAPASALAQAPADTTPPTVTIASPADGATFVVDQPVLASYGCSDDVGVADCVGTVANGTAIDTSSAGPHTFTVTSHDTSGNPASKTVSYNVVVSDPGPIDGGAPATLTLSLGSAAPFAPLIPGLAKSYMTSMTAHIVSSAGDGLLTVADPDAANPGHLVNGAYVLPSPLSASATSPTGVSAGSNPIAGTAAPTTLETWAGPANEDITLVFTQPIAVSDVLRTGSYSKTLTFTLSTTQP